MDESKKPFKMINDEQSSEIIKWWKGLLERNGPRASLKRCSSPEDAALFPDTFQIKRIVSPWVTYEAAASIAGLLSHIRAEGESDNASFAQQLAGIQGKDQQALLSETRFRQLISSKNWNELYTRMRRAIKILDGKVNPLSIASIILRWDNEHHSGINRSYGHSLRFDLSNEYYTQLEKITNK
jgi:CRISPR type I-E-associated protein CasB/Cse2